MQDRLNITKELVIKYLAKFKDLDEFKFEPDDYIGEKYILLFDKSTKYWLKIVISFKNGTIAVITAHLANKTQKEKANLLKLGN
ncbi:MAG: hypothetical protein SVV03_01700 [Candidatus Nanohaloarchaea archaeon]|nr:hypothetical protein [Candidatus Nanohaloarchaea archaeon]